MRIITTLLLSFVSFVAFSQTEVLLDFESPETTTSFTYFESDLTGESNNIIENPDPSGINTSPTVADFVHPNNGQPWAGAFADPGFQVNTNSAIDICMKVWFNEPGNVALKLETGTIDNWILQQEVTETMTWTEICFDLATPSIEGPFLPGVNGVFESFVLFFDFLEVPDVSRMYFFDDVVITYGEPEDVTVEFTVDMNSYAETIDEVLLRGQFNGWSEDNPMTDNGDGTWSTSITAPAGITEYKYYVREGDVWEEFALTDECVATSFGAPGEVFTNRSTALVDGATISSCWNSCYACEDRATLTFNLGFADGVTAADSVYLAGGGNFEAPGGRFLMDDSDGDGVYSITLNRSVGFSSFYTFANGPCPDFSCKEDISGLDCADPDNFNDRFLEPMTGATVISTCFGECTEDTNCTAVSTVDVTWRVDMSESDINPEGVFYAGQITNWENAEMTDDNGDDVYEITFAVESGNYEYKFKNGVDGWEIFEDGAPCTTTFDDGNGGIFVNRLLVVDESDTDFSTTAFCFDACESCLVNTNDLVSNENLFDVSPSISSGDFIIELENANVQLSVIDINGKVLQRISATDNVMDLDLSHLAQGMYFINGQTENYFKTSRIIIQ